MRFLFPVNITAVTDGPPAEHGFLVTFPDLPEANTWGDTRDEALANAVDCLEEALAGRIVDRQVVPTPSPAGRRPTIAPGGLIAAKVALYIALRESGLSSADLARRMKVQPSVITRLLDWRIDNS